MEMIVAPVILGYCEDRGRLYGARCGGCGESTDKEARGLLADVHEETLAGSGEVRMQ